MSEPSTWCIYLSVNHAKLDDIQRLRAQFDPLAETVPPHVTVVFPFATDWPRDELIALAQRAPIPTAGFGLSPPVAHNGCLYFPLRTGQEVQTLHEFFHSRLPAKRSSERFIPHVTFGRVEQVQTMATALENATRVLPVDNATFVNLVVAGIVERAGRTSITIEHERPLGR